MLRQRRKRVELQGDFNAYGFSLPRLRYWDDGDGQGNAIAYIGVEVSTEHGDPGISVGFQMRAAPGSLIYRFTGWLRERGWGKP